MTSFEVLLKSIGTLIGQFGNTFTVFQVDYFNIQLLFMQNFGWKAETWWIWSRGTWTTSKDTWTEMCGDGEGAAT